MFERSVLFCIHSTQCLGVKKKYIEKEQCSRHPENWLFREQLQSNDTELGGQCVRLMQASFFQRVSPVMRYWRSIISLKTFVVLEKLILMKLD